ncbi:MAG: hypothetical protein D6797_09655, partial [Bdellovibrio sp.]
MRIWHFYFLAFLWPSFLFAKNISFEKLWHKNQDILKKIEEYEKDVDVIPEIQNYEKEYFQALENSTSFHAFSERNSIGIIKSQILKSDFIFLSDFHG